MDQARRTQDRPDYTAAMSAVPLFPARKIRQLAGVLGLLALVWGGFALALLLAPRVFSSGASVSMLSLMGTVMIYALSYNMLLGQSGMLSFGHAVYSGLGAFFAMHAMKAIGAGTLAWPISLLPLIGGTSSSICQLPPLVWNTIDSELSVDSASAATNI